ncbi:hypothetical protein J3Q64DRAFT_1812614 [Phycomyces blakesleeanus]|uniref:TauD/TfdA-like domain-containing protein n=2 Tax=Phycomyces blakesleeanus TaxID=4837 RepID=A0A167QFA6_PHYB8|nr:hypothetical protein PHYBLDRAFT_130023 [Phycomyces blakesleeanus NRRL 1555(-)]OAD79611.1 hypothetical protein PHYBLDRAFT_130023 [Phycomyces blakesleeanus NRRL 1555(-)]|eukprot:XP_018297651.1 hypothetical protein PHYBLDRAFT_130023 [Phycomyces blakesleeanus NRRL 1555(-)]
MSAAVHNTTDSDKPAQANEPGKWRSFSTQDENAVAAVFPDRVTGPSVWDGKYLENHPEEWIYYLTEDDIKDIDSGLKHFNSLNLPLIEIKETNFPLGNFTKIIKKHQEDFFKGTGFGLLRGFPITKYDRKDQAAIFMGIGSYIGTLKPQNAKGHVLGHIKDLTTGSTTKSVYNVDDPTTRIYATRKAQPFHADGTDIVALLCLSEGESGGLSSVISSHTLYNRLSDLRPDIVELLKQAWLWDKKGEHGPNEAPYLAAPPIVFHKDHLFTFWGPHFYETVTRFPGVTVEAEKFEAMEYVQKLCEREALNMRLEVGDIQLVQNYQLLHARTAYTDSPEKTRHLLRLWLMVNDRDVRWSMPYAKDDVNYDYAYLGKQTVPLEAE